MAESTKRDLVSAGNCIFHAVLNVQVLEKHSQGRHTNQMLKSWWNIYPESWNAFYSRQGWWGPLRKKAEHPAPLGSGASLEQPANFWQAVPPACPPELSESQLAQPPSATWSNTASRAPTLFGDPLTHGSCLFSLVHLVSILLVAPDRCVSPWLLQKVSWRAE